MQDTPLNQTFSIRHNLSDILSHDASLVRRQTFPKSGIRREMPVALLLLFLSLILPPQIAPAQGFNGDNQACAFDAPCFNGSHQEGNTVVFQFTGTCCWDFFNVRYAQAGGGEKQVENKSGTYILTDTKPNSVYSISVQGCTSHTLSHSTCTSWTQSSVTTAPETGSVSSRVVTPATPPSGALAEPPKVIGRINGGSQTPSQASQELAGKGSKIVSANMFLTAMRDVEPEGPQRVGFEKGVAIGADQTAWGPGKQAMIDSLPEAERTSAERSAHFIVARNVNSKLDHDGVSIAEQETRADVIAARSAEPAGFYTLGFDIGAGIFATVARGGAGHTLPGPGSASIRNSLPPPGVRGFDASMKLYMRK